MATTYYRDDAVHISSSGVRVRESWYPLETLSYVWHRRTGKLRHGAYMITTRVAAIVLIVTLVAGSGIAARRINVSGDQKAMLIVGGAFAVVLLGGFAAFGVEGLLALVDRTHEHNRGLHEIWVRSGDREMMIYATTDTTRFGKTYRALQRAVENGS
jgi:Family of unknown function (DUF6232)